MITPWAVAGMQSSNGQKVPRRVNGGPVGRRNVERQAAAFANSGAVLLRGIITYETVFKDAVSQTLNLITYCCTKDLDQTLTLTHPHDFHRIPGTNRRAQ
jgi:hypothetical protein